MVQRKPLTSQITPFIQRQEVEEPEGEEEEILQTKEVTGGAPARITSIEAQINNMRGNGQPLPDTVRAFFEPRFGYDFSRVRVHTDANAEESARSVNALAYTVGRDIAFGMGQYTPETNEGRWLLTHELAHVVQQSGAYQKHVDNGTGMQSLTTNDTFTQKVFGTVARQTAGFPAFLQSTLTGQQQTPKGVTYEASHISIHTQAPLSVARKDHVESSSGSTVGYVAIYLGNEIQDEAYIDFHTDKGMFRYHLEEYGSLRPGEYQANVTVKGNNVEFSFNVEGGELFRFGYRIEPGQPNPKTFFAHQSTVTFTITAEKAPELHHQEPNKEEKNDPNVVYLTVEEAMKRCQSGDMPGVKVFPFRGTRFGGAPITVFRDGNDIVVKSYVYVLGNTDFRAQTKTLPTETFVGGIRLKPNEVVRVHTYEPRWYHINITGSTSGDIEDEFCVTGEQMLQIGEMSDSAVKWNIALTVVDAATLILPVGKIASFIGRPLLRGGRGLAAAMMLGLRDAAPTALAGIASRTSTIIVEEQVVNQAASRAISESTSHVLIQFSQQPAKQVVSGVAGEAIADVGAGGAVKQVFSQTVTVTVVDATGSSIVSTVTTPTGDSALDQAIDNAFNQTFNMSSSQSAGAALQQGVVSVAPEIAAGFTQAQVIAFKRILSKSFSESDIAVLQQIWNATARPGDAAILNAGNSRYLFDLQRNRFWSRVAANPQARALFTDAGCQFSGGAPYYMLNGRRIVITIDHIVERQTSANLALTASNLRLAFSRENSVVLRLLNQLDPFQQ